MEEQEKVRVFGLLGKDISYSFSQGYFTKKFQLENILDARYQNFDIPSIDQFIEVLKTKQLRGLNVTIPYKEAVIPFIDALDPDAKNIGAVNTIQISDGKVKGYNTDVIGFENSLEPLLKEHHRKALILGTGGAAKAVNFVLDKLHIESLKVSRNPKSNEIAYKDLNEEVMSEYSIIINTTPLGTFPKTEACPDIPFNYVTSKHILYDLIYNPAKTKFLELGEQQGATIKNGLEMLQIQAEYSWKIWNQV